MYYSRAKLREKIFLAFAVGFMFGAALVAVVLRG